MLIDAGSAPGGADVANLLKAALARRFQPVKIDEPGVDDAALMLRGLEARYEAARGVSVRDDAVDAAVRLSARYITGRLLPDKVRCSRASRRSCSPSWPRAATASGSPSGWSPRAGSP